MAVPIETCLDFETSMNSASYCMVSASIDNIYRPRESNIKYTPAVDITWTTGLPESHLQPILNSSGSVSKYYYDVYNGSLNINVVTERSSNDVSHEDYVGEIYDQFSDQYNYNEYLTYHQVLDVKPGDTITLSDTETNHDISQLSFDIKLCVIPSAWPSEE